MVLQVRVYCLAFAFNAHPGLTHSGTRCYDLQPFEARLRSRADRHTRCVTLHWIALVEYPADGSGTLCSAGEHHCKQRKLLNPVFSINHMRHMMPTFYTVTHRVNSSLQ